MQSTWGWSWQYGGVTFLWTDEVPAGTGMMTWATFPEESPYFGAGPQRSMINYRVDDLDALLTKLEAAGVEIDPMRDDSPYGKFAWITDPEGNRMKLWEPLASSSGGV